MNDNMLISKLNNQIKELNYELEKNKIYISNLELSILNLENKYEELHSRYMISSSKEIEYEKLLINLKEKNELISDLEKEMSINRKNYEKERREFNSKYEHDVKEVQYLNGKLNIKNDNTSKIEKLNDILYNHTLQLERKILDFKKDEEKRAKDKEHEYEKKISEIKQSMLDYIREGKNLKDKNSKATYKILEKFSIMNHNTLLKELEFESLQLEDLLKQRQHLDQIILKMKCDLEIHQKVEKLLINKNKKYIDRIRILSIKANEKKINKEENKNDYKEKSNSIEDLPSFPEISKNIIIPRFKNNINKKNKSLTNRNFYKEQYMKNLNNSSMKELDIKKIKKMVRINSTQTIYSERQKNEQIEKINLQKQLTKKSKELEESKSLCDYYKEKIHFFNNKYKNIIILLDEALEKIYEENKSESLKDISINLNEFKNCNFEKLSSDKKCSIIIFLIQYILPLINEDNIPQHIKMKIKKINTNIYFNETTDSSHKVKKNNSSIGKKVKLNINEFKKIKNNVFEERYKSKRNNKININSIRQLIGPKLKGNTSYDNFKNDLSKCMNIINPPSEFKNF